MLYPGKFSDRFLDGRFEVAILEIQSILPATYFRRRIRFLQHLCKTYKRHHRHVPSLDKNVQFPRNFDFSFEYFHSSSSDRDSTRRGIQDSHVPTTTIIYLNYEYSINAKCRFLINGIVHTNERDVNIVDNAYELDYDENKTWNFGIEHREFDEEEERVRRTIYTRLCFLSVEEIIFSLHFFLKHRLTWINK